MPLCPVCKQVMVQVEEAGVCAASCPGCHGTWISATALERRERLESAPGGEQTTLPPLTELAATAAESDSKNPLNCPVCTHVMSKQRFHDKIPVMVDRCIPCGHVWLDAGEQGLLLTLYRELVASGGTAIQQERLDRLQQVQQNRASYSSSGSGYAGSNVDTAISVGVTVLGVVLDMFLSSGSSYGHRNRW